MRVGGGGGDDGGRTVLGVAGIAAAIDAAAWMTAEGQREAAMRRPTDAPAEIDVLGKQNQEWFKEHK